MEERMNTDTGELYNLQRLEDSRKALAAVMQGQEVAPVSEDEVERLQKMSRQMRRAELRKRPKMEAEELKRLIAAKMAEGK
jgi:hypothetical protein